MRWVSRPERGSLFWAKFLFRACNRIGRRVCNWLAIPAIAYFVLSSKQARRSSRTYLARVQGQDSPNSVPLNLVFKHFLAFAYCLIDKVAVWGGRLQFQNCRWHGKDQVRALVDQGKGVLIFSAHFGNIEICRAISTELPRLKIAALMYKQHARRYNELLKELNFRSNLDVIEVETVGPALLVALQSRLSKGDSLGLLADRVTPGAPEKTVQAEFLGSPALFPAGPWILASLLDAPIYLCFAIRDRKGDYDVYFEPFSEKLTLARADRELALESIVARYVERLEHYCKLSPLQWFNFYDFWENSGALTKSESAIGLQTTPALSNSETVNAK